MKKSKVIMTYKKEQATSYASGAYATIEMLHARPEAARAVYIHSDYRDKEPLEALCETLGVPVRYGDKQFSRINQKENCYVLGMFEKFEQELDKNAPHVVLVNPSDMGNLGTIVRTLAGFGILDLAIITPAADIWHPKTIRASMGALFRMRFNHFAAFEDYAAMYSDHSLYPFLLDAEHSLRAENVPKDRLFTLVFGNEATGLGVEFKGIGTSMKIPQTDLVDSLNLSIAVGIAGQIFAGANGLI